MGKSTSFLYLNEEDMIKAGVLDSAHCIDVIFASEAVSSDTGAASAAALGARAVS